MITVKQVLENYDILTEKADNDSKNLVALVHAGLLDESQLPILRRAMSKPAINMTEAEKKALQGLVESVSSSIISEKQDHLSKLDTSRSMGYPPEKDIPAVIILKRKAIRVYPDNQKVALYYSQALDRYISIPYGRNSKALDMTLNEGRLDEISQETVARAYVKRTQRIKDRQDDSELSPEQKAMAITAEKKKRKMLAQRMMTNVADKQTGKPLRSWAGKEAVKTAKLASKMSPAKPIDNEQIRKMTAKERSEKGITFGQASKAAISGGDPAAIVGAIAGMGLRRMVGLDKPKPKPIMKESFRKKLEEKRQEKLNEEGAWDATKAFAGNLASSATFGGSDYIGRKLSKNWDAERERLDKEHSTAATVGDIAGYAVPGLGAIKGAKLAAKGVKAGAEALSKTTAGKYARVIKRKVGGKLAGAASLAAGAAGIAAGALGGSGGGSDEPLLKKTSGEFSFGNIKPQVSGTPVDPLQTASGVVSAQRSANIQKTAFKESNNLNILKQMVEHNISSHVIHINETPITINNRVAKKVVNVYESLNRQNKKKVEKMLNEDATSFKKIINFSVRQ